jgi:homogentisate 1,2-dioxygenase
MAFMFETRFPQRVTAHAAKQPGLQKNYIGCWDGLQKRFNPRKRQAW